MNTPFWLVWNECGHAPTKKHDSFESAKREAERLARNNRGQQFAVLQSVSAFIVDDIKQIDLRPQGYHEDGIPF